MTARNLFFHDAIKKSIESFDLCKKEYGESPYTV